MNANIKKIISALTESESGKKQMEIWDWFQGVALYGLYLYYEKTQDQEVFEYLTGWFDAQIEKGEPIWNVNSLSPLLTLTFLYEKTKKESYLARCERGVKYAMEELLRTEEGGFQHVTLDSNNDRQLWGDTLYMGALFMARMGILVENDDYMQESIRQFLLHIKYLADTETGLYFHGYNFIGKHHYAGAHWGRCNAWIIASLVEILNFADGYLPGSIRMYLHGTLESLADTLAQYQDADGMWHTLVDDMEGSYQEASATSGIAYAMLKAVRLGLLPESYKACALRALPAINGLIDEEGFCGQVSAGTCLENTLDYYRSIKINRQPYGQSLALLFLLEAENC
ncbi:MAG: glycoside hydrolase family 88 protein [Lachnospiraceae bacterium]|nr:glycoside hydrolase family 88 protein [Lachnospiraceae bacterium]